MILKHYQQFLRSLKGKKYCIVCGKFKKPKKSYILEKVLVLSVICSICGSKDEKMFKGKESVEILKILGLIKNIEKYQKNTTEKNINQEFRLKQIGKIRT